MGFVPSMASREFPLQWKLPTLNAPAALILFLSVKEVPKVCAAIQKDLNSLEKWADRAHHMKNNGRYKILQLGRNSPRYQCVLGSHQLENHLAEKDLEGMVDTLLNTSQQRALVATKAGGIWEALGGVLPAGLWRWSFHSTQHRWDNTWDTVSSCGLPCTRET